MAKPSDLAPWASDVRTKHGKLVVTLRRGLDLNGVLNLLKTQDLSNIRSLKVPGSVGLSGLRALLASNQLTALGSIALNGFADADDAADLLFEARGMSQLRVLKLWGASDAIDMRLARGDFVDSLRQLDIRHSPEVTALDRFFASKRISSLRYLTVQGTGLADGTVLLQNSEAVNITSLTLARCEFDAETVDGLLTSPNLPSLRRLNLSYNREGDVISAIYRLLRSRELARLDTLRLCGCEIEGFDWDRVDYPEIERLDLRDNPLGLDEIQEIIEAPGLPKLKELVVSAPGEMLPPRLDKRIVIDDRRPGWAR